MADSRQCELDQRTADIAAAIPLKHSPLLGKVADQSDIDRYGGVIAEGLTDGDYLAIRLDHHRQHLPTVR